MSSAERSQEPIPFANHATLNLRITGSLSQQVQHFNFALSQFIRSVRCRSGQGVSATAQSDAEGASKAIRIPSKKVALALLLIAILLCSAVFGSFWYLGYKEKRESLQ